MVFPISAEVISIAIYFTGVSALLLVSYLIVRIVILYFHLEPKNYIVLEIIPPAKTEKTSYTTQQLFSLIHAIGQQKSFWHRFFRIHAYFSFEIFSTHQGGIRYVMRVRKEYVENIKRSVISYLSFSRVSVIDDYLMPKVDTSQGTYKLVEFRQTAHFAYPLQKQDMLEEHDPVAYLTGMMTKLNSDELVSVQFLISPASSSKAKNIRSKILANQNVFEDITASHGIGIVRAFGSFIFWCVNTFTQDLFYSGREYRAQTPNRITQNVFEQQLIGLIKQKIEQPLFETHIRCLVKMATAERLHERVAGIASSMSMYSSVTTQSLGMRRFLLDRFLSSFYYVQFLHRVSLGRSGNLLSVSEMSDLYHFPFTQVTQTENIVKVHSKKLPAPLSLKQHSDFDISFARNTYGGVSTPIGLRADERARHMYVLGATGSGKSTLLLSMIKEDIQSERTVCLIDPHGDLALSGLDCVPASRLKDVVYFNPFDIAYPVGINLLETTPGLSEDDTLLEQEFITESVVSLFRKVFSEGSSGHPHRIEYMLRNTIHTAFTVENPTLFTIFDLLNDPGYQKEVVSKLTDEHLLNFWKYEFGKAGDYQKVKMVSPVTARIGRFLFSPSARRVLEQKRSTINFEEMLDTKKILICNLSKGNIGEDTSEVFGVMILNKLQLALLKRARREQVQRKQFYLYVDEFQNFATPSFVQMLSESRKYGLHLTIAEQSTSQQNDRNMVNTILANVGNVVAFRSANPQDEDLLLRQFSPYVQRGDLANLPAFHFYMKISALSPEEPFSGETIVPDISTDRTKRDAIIQCSRRMYAKPYEKSAMEIVKTPKMRTKRGKKEPIVASVMHQSVFPEDM